MALNLAKAIKEEALRALPAIIYFFIAFSLIELTFGRMLEHAGIHAVAFLETVVAAVVVGKVLIIVDHLPIANIAANRPLVYKILIKSAIYSFGCFLFRSLEHMVRYTIKYKTLASAWDHSMTPEMWQLFLTIQVWYFLLFLVFVSAREVIKRIGRDEFMKIYFG